MFDILRFQVCSEVSSGAVIIPISCIVFVQLHIIIEVEPFVGEFRIKFPFI
jgi:hypothetical protein